MEPKSGQEPTKFLKNLPLTKLNRAKRKQTKKLT